MHLRAFYNELLKNGFRKILQVLKILNVSFRVPVKDLYYPFRYLCTADISEYLDEFNFEKLTIKYTQS